jgi:hypothetical protein
MSAPTTTPRPKSRRPLARNPISGTHSAPQHVVILNGVRRGGRSEGSAFASGTPRSRLLPNRRRHSCNPESSTHFANPRAVILNAVKDLRLLLASFKRR